MFYLGWHYSTAFADGARTFVDGLRFLWYFFSIEELYGTFFAPWKRMATQYPSVFEPFEYLQTAVSNGVLRIVGIAVRTAVIVAGSITMGAYIALWVAVALVWMIVPVALALGILLSVTSLMVNW